MKPMRIGKAKEKIYTPKKTIYEHDKNLRSQAIEISKNQGFLDYINHTHDFLMNEI